MSLAKEVLSRSIQARDERRAIQTTADKGRGTRAVAGARSDAEKVRRRMPDAGPHARYAEKMRLGYNRARQAGIDRGRETMAAEKAGSTERATDRLNRQRATRKARSEKEGKSRELYHAGLSKLATVSKSPLSRLSSKMQQTGTRAIAAAKTKAKVKVKASKEKAKSSKKKAESSKKGGE